MASRRFLRDLVKKETQKSVFRTKYSAMAAPALLLLCCSFLCPCFRSRRKDTDSSILVRESNSCEYNCIILNNFRYHQNVKPSSPLCTLFSHENHNGFVFRIFMKIAAFLFLYMLSLLIFR